RIERMTDPGQVYISGGIYEQIKNKLVCGYESLGDRKVKNITDPVRIYRVLPDPAALKTRRQRTNVLVAAFGLLWLGLASAAVGYLMPKLKLEASAPGPPSWQAVPATTQAEPAPVPSVAPADK